MAQLSLEHGEVINLVYYHGKSVKEVAEIIGINGGAHLARRMMI